MRRIRFAKESELDQINSLRKQVNDLHAKGRPDIFRQGFPGELQDHIHEIWADPLRRIVVCEERGGICAYAVLHRILKPETPFMLERACLEIDEFGVDAACRRQGIATEMIEFVRDHARREGFDRIELNMWEFNRGALACYEALGFSTYRR